MFPALSPLLDLSVRGLAASVRIPQGILLIGRVRTSRRGDILDGMVVRKNPGGGEIVRSFRQSGRNLIIVPRDFCEGAQISVVSPLARVRFKS